MGLLDGITLSEGARLGGPGSGRSGSWPTFQAQRGTLRQVCGMWPMVVGGSVPMVGAPLGRVFGQPGFLCADHLAWFERGLISAPSALVLGLNGLGKSSLVRRMVLGMAHRGVHTMVLGDIKPDYRDLVEALGGQVITIGPGHGGINPLDAGNVADAVALLGGEHRAEQEALEAAAHERRKTMVLSLIQILRHSAPTPREEIIVDEALKIIFEDAQGQPVLADLLTVVRQAPDRVRQAALDRGSMDRYREVTEELEIALLGLLDGRLGRTFAATTTTPMRMDRDVVFDVSPLIHEHSDLQAAVLLGCWSYGFATVEIAQTLADVGVAPRRRYSLVMDELWRILQASSGMVARVDSLTRLNRTVGVAQMMITHSMADFSQLPSEEDRIKAQGFVERSKMLFLGGLPAREMPMLRGVHHFSHAEEETLSSWNAPGAWDPHRGAAAPPPGRGKFMLKTSSAPGIPFQVSFAPGEADMSQTSKRFDQAVSHEPA